MTQMTVKNRRSRVSPGGVVTLTLAARKALQMTPGSGARVTVAVEDGAVLIAPAGDGGFRVSPAGQLVLRGDAREVLERGGNRNYYLELDDEKQSVTLRPYE